MTKKERNEWERTKDNRNAIQSYLKELKSLKEKLDIYLDCYADNQSEEDLIEIQRLNKCIKNITKRIRKHVDNLNPVW